MRFSESGAVLTAVKRRSITLIVYGIQKVFPMQVSTGTPGEACSRALLPRVPTARRTRLRQRPLRAGESPDRGQFSFEVLVFGDPSVAPGQPRVAELHERLRRRSKLSLQSTLNGCTLAVWIQGNTRPRRTLRGNFETLLFLRQPARRRCHQDWPRIRPVRFAPGRRLPIPRFKDEFPRYPFLS